ncbi:hypothetical protein HPB50_013124 [Hyalomma asiaticum]|uniref:Uncharacterized protein n=1 Tax=Hyalomma asiaticum TaxID=266040 RepID=A0ACB7T745_HYAAI|nr:hypothetical protein HPB50_013124 [Hyalomma asiaticum]
MNRQDEPGDHLLCSLYGLELDTKNPQRVQPVGLVPHAGNAAQVVVKPQPVAHGAAVTEAAIHKVALETRVRTCKIQDPRSLTHRASPRQIGFGGLGSFHPLSFSVLTPAFIATGNAPLTPPIGLPRAEFGIRSPLRPPALGSTGPSLRCLVFNRCGIFNDACNARIRLRCTRCWMYRSQG